VNIITILTDFGVKDPYVGIMKGVMLSVNRQLTIIDISHEVAVQDVREASFLIGEYYPYFSTGTIHLCIVDPGVGSNRRALVVEKGGHRFVGPDNGIFSLILTGGAEVYEIADRRFMLSKMSATFHGRDVFAPAAAYLSLLINASDFGPAVADPVVLSNLSATVEGKTMTGEIVRFDRFGNAITNIRKDLFDGFVQEDPYLIKIGDLAFPSLSRSYYENEYTCVTGSSGYLEFGRFKGNFAESRKLQKGDSVTVEKR
jgi:hypothetical protein